MTLLKRSIRFCALGLGPVGRAPNGPPVRGVNAGLGPAATAGAAVEVAGLSETARFFRVMPPILRGAFDGFCSDESDGEGDVDDCSSDDRSATVSKLFKKYLARYRSALSRFSREAKGCLKM